MTEDHAATVADHSDAAHHVNYMLVFGALCALTLLSVLADLMGGIEALSNAIGHFNTKLIIGFIVLTVACFKASFVMLYFMHLKFEGKWKFVLLAPTFVLAMALVVTLAAEIAVHYYTFNTPQSAVTASVEHGGSAAPAHAAPAH